MTQPKPDGALVLGPLLRRVTADSATIWVQTARASTVAVRADEAVGTATTFTVYGMHFALVVVRGLPAGTSTRYTVEIDGTPVWPPADYDYPAPVIRTRGDDAEPVTIVFGSCRESTPYQTPGLEPDALDAYAVRLATDSRSSGGSGVPDLLMLIGDQVYADVTSKSTRAWLRRRRPFRHRGAPPKQVVDFAEFARLYLESWTDPDVRWLLSTVSTVMMFDDHEIIDDWNTSASWRDDMTKLPWWHKRITAGLASYWVFQHAGNLRPDELPDDPAYRTILAVGTADASDVLHAFAERADADSDAYRWSFSFDIGRTRVAVLDNRCARVLDPGHRAMLPPSEWDWFAGQARGGGYDHLVIGSSLPWLMPFGIHDLEAASERWTESRSALVVAAGERLRRTFDLEHWASFGASFDDLAELLGAIGSGRAGFDAPASISVLSGDVHHSYVARAAYGSGVTTPVYQLTCSPFHNRVPAALRPLMRLAWHRRGKRIGRVLARRAGATRPLVSWHKLAGPYFGNAIATLRHDGHGAIVTMEGTNPEARLVQVIETKLA